MSGSWFSIALARASTDQCAILGAGHAAGTTKNVDVVIGKLPKHLGEPQVVAGGQSEPTD